MPLTSCIHHPAATAHFRCRPCAAYLCRDCATPAGSTGMHQCRSCAAIASAIDPEQPQGASSFSTSFARNLPGILAYLKEPSVWMGLSGMAVVAALLTVLGHGLMLLCLIAAIEISVFFHITLSTARGSRGLEAADFRDPFDALVVPFFLCITAFFPLLASLAWAGMSPLLVSVETMEWQVPLGPRLAIYASIALVPLTLTIAAVDRSFLSVLNPLVWAETLRAFGLNYVLAALFFYGMWYLELLLTVHIAVPVFLAVDFPIVGLVLYFLIGYLPCALRYRALGALCEPLMSQRDEVETALPIVSNPLATASDAAQASATQARNSLAALSSGELDDREILEVARQAASQENYRLLYRAVENLWKQHPDSACLPAALWLAAQGQEASGEIEAMTRTLKTLIGRDPEHPLAEEARQRLDALA